jgi:hypothetical protein
MKDDDRMPVFEFAYTPPEEYDFEIEFTRNGGSVAHILAAQGRNFVHEFTQGPDNGNPARAGISYIDGKNINSTNEGWVLNPPPPRNGTRHVAVVEVRRGGVRSFLDGKPVLNWTGDFSRLKSPPGFRLSGSETHLGLGGWNADVTFHRATVREISGRGKLESTDALAGGAKTNVTLDELKELADLIVVRKGFAVVQTAGVRRKITQPSDVPSSFEQLLEVEISGYTNGNVPPKLLAALTRATEIVRLGVANCNLTNQEAKDLIANKPGLKYVDLHTNQIDDSIVHTAAELPLLESLNLGYVKTITGAGFDALAGRPQFVSLTVNDCALTESGLRAIGKITGLKSLNLQGLKMTGAGLEPLSGLSRLEVLYIKNTDITVNHLASLRNAANLRRMEVSFGRGIKTPGELASLGSVFPAFKEVLFDLGGGPTELAKVPLLSQIGDLAQLRALTRLECRGSASISASKIAGLDRLPLLDYLDIYYSFKDEDVALLKGCKTLKNLRLGNAKLSEIGALELASVVSLREVNRTAFTDAGLKAFREHRSDVKIFE